jgi:hypothetical protein
MQNKRKFRRVVASLDVVWIEGEEIGQGRVVDLCLGGCFIEPENKDTFLGEEIELELKIPSGEELIISATIVHVKPGKGFGVSFGFMTEDKIALLLKTIDYYRENRS